MSEPQASTTGLTDTARLHMFRRAGETERANRPRWMVVLAGAVLVLTAVYALLGWLDRNDAVRNLRSARTSDANLSLVLDEIRGASQAPETTGGIGPYDPLPNPQTMLERFAERAGLERPDPPSAREEEVGEGISRRTYQYTIVRHPTPEALIRWLDSVERNIAGMRVDNLDLRPNSRRDGWELSVRFSRLEKTS